MTMPSTPQTKPDFLPDAKVFGDAALRRKADDPPRPGRLCRLGLLGITAWLGAGCSNLVDIRPLATGQPDIVAYELRGTDLAALRRRADTLCPQGSETLRQAARDQRPAQEDGSMQRWLNAAGALFVAPQRDAQLVMSCKVVATDRQSPAASTIAAAASAVPNAPASPKAPPVGPLNIEW